MKTLYTTLTCLFCAAFSQAQLIQWEPEITVADGAVYGNGRPRATLVNNDPVVIFGKQNSTENLYIARWNGTGFNTPISIVPSGSSSYITDWTGPDIDSYGQTVVATFKLMPLESGHVYSVRSTDGGMTFSDTIRVDDHPVGVAWLPSMAMDMNGNPLVTYMAHDNVWSNPRYVLVRSSDGGLTYGQEQEVTAPVIGEVCDCCPAELAVRDNKVALLFRNNESNIRDIYAFSSNDGGVSFPYHDDLDQLGWSISSCPSTGPAGAFASNRLLNVYASAASGKYRVYVSSATTDGPIGFEARAQVLEPDLANGTQNYPRISASGDTVVMAWRETLFGNHEIFCSLALPGSDPLLSLSTAKQQSNESTNGMQTNPEIIYKNGFVHLFYQDNGSGDLMYRRGTVNTSAGLEELEQSLSVYPNPSEGTLFVSRELENIQVHTLQGQSISFLQENFGDQLRITLLEAPAGLYVISGELFGKRVEHKIEVR